MVEKPNVEWKIYLKRGKKMTEKRFKIEEYLAPPSVQAKWVSEFLKWYAILLKDCDEEELKELFDLIRFDWKIFKGDDGND